MYGLGDVYKAHIMLIVGEARRLKSPCVVPG